MSADEPIAFPVEASPLRDGIGAGELRAAVRALNGMQKEAVVASATGGWRLFCDEGHYLNGTDLAPPPLDVFSAGMQFSVLASILEAARRNGVTLDGLGLEQTTVYHIEGSFLGGDARGSAEAPQIELFVESNADEAAIAATLRAGVEGAPALALARDVLDNRFGLAIGEKRVPIEGLRSTEARSPRPDLFDRLEPGAAPAADVVSKLTQAERVENDPHGAGVGLKAEQRRTIQIRGRAEWLGGVRFGSDVELIHPIGSSFRFHADAEGREAPAPEMLLVAGVAFCTMTQLGRYAAIRKRPLADYRLLQTSRFEQARSGRALADPFDTEIFLDGGWQASDAADLARVGERTCYLHATMREALEPRVAAYWKGKRLEP